MRNGGRILFTAPKSGSGKTTVVCAILQALVEDGAAVTAFKSGPDYIDPMFHRNVLGVPSHNLDLFLFGSGEKGALTARRLVSHYGAGTLSIIEGAMGYYDGLGTTEESSAYDLARALESPVVLIVDGRGAALSLAATLRGFATFRPDSRIRGFILNNVKPHVYAYYKDVLEKETGLTAYGYLPTLPECSLESRHLGLVTAGEISDLQAVLQRLSGAARESIDLQGLMALAQTAPKLNEELPALTPLPHVRLAVADDEAFCFYYACELELFEALGAELVSFSPLRDSTLPDCDALYLGGGYPELYAQELADNDSMCASMKASLADGLPCFAECGGFMYLLDYFAEGDKHYPWVGAIAGTSRLTDHLNRFGYTWLTFNEDTLLGAAGTRLPAHEFHYSDSTDNGTACTAQKVGGRRHWSCVHASKTLFAGYPHLHLAAYPEVAARFLQQALAYKKRRNGFCI